MKVKVARIGEGVHPSEVVVAVTTLDGTENLVIAKRSFDAEGIDVGFPIRADDGRYLIELPRETLSGSWRVWVNSDQILDNEGVKA